MLLLAAGSGTTWKQMGITLTRTLLQRPDVLTRCGRIAPLLRPAIEESLRWQPTDPMFSRWVTQDTELGGVHLPKGSVVHLCLGAAEDRDPGRGDPGDDLPLAAGALRSPADRFRRSRREAAGARRAAGSGDDSKARRWRIPVVYGGEHGIDLEDVAKTLNTTPDDIVARHTAGHYRVAMIGFTPGWSYLSGLADFLHLPRRQNPRLLTPAGTISIGGVQTGVQCLAGPSGWHLLGQTAVRTYQLHRDPIFLLEPGDQITFAAVDAKTFAEQDRAAEAGEFVAELLAS